MTEPRCLVCEEWIPLFQDGDFELPIDAVIVQINGGFGSKVYNVPGGEHLSAYLCDLCLTAKITNGLIDRVQVIALKDARIRSEYTVPGD